jgi:glycosyltransferase involved in cell wall biosynthesis
MADERPVTARHANRVLMSVDAVGGVWQYSIDLARALNREGTEVLLANMGPPPDERQRRQVRSLPSTTLVEGQFALEWMQNPWSDVDHAGDWLLGLADLFRPDVVHLNGYALAALDWKAPVVSVAHSCVCSWWAAVHGSAPPGEWCEYKHRVAVGLHAADAVIAPSNFMARAIAAEYGVSAGKISVIHNFSSSAPGAMPEKESFALAAGRFWDQAKNLNLLRAIAQRVSWPVHIAGSDNAATGDVPGLHELGTLPHSDLLGWMDRSSLFLHPALYEPFGLVVLEAAQRGCCLVLADIPSLRELWQGAAVFVDPRDESSWISALNRLIENSSERNRFAALARARSAHFGELNTRARYIDVYRVLLNGKAEAA